MCAFRLAKQMLEARLKSAEDAEDGKRRLQQAALAKYRQAFTDDAEVCHNQLLWGHDSTACIHNATLLALLGAC